MGIQRKKPTRRIKAPPGLIIDRIKSPDVDEEKSPYPDTRLFSAFKEYVDLLFISDPGADEKELFRQCNSDILALERYVDENYNPRRKLKRDTPKWQKQMLQSEPKLKKVFEFFDFIKANTVPFGATPHNRKHKEKDFVMFKPDYLQMIRKSGLSERQLRKYFKRLTELDFLKILRAGRGSRMPTVYAVGVWGSFKDEKTGKGGPRRLFFFKKEAAKVLRDFRL